MLKLHFRNGQLSIFHCIRYLRLTCLRNNDFHLHKSRRFSPLYNIYVLVRPRVVMFFFVKSEISREVMFFYFASRRRAEPGCIPAFYREVYEKICSPTSGNVEREVFKSLLVKSQLSSSVLSQVCLLFVSFSSLSPCR